MAVGPWQLLIIVLVILLLFGGARLAEIGKGLGEGIRNFKNGLSDEERNATPDEPIPPKELSSANDSAEEPFEGKESAEVPSPASDEKDGAG